MEDGGGGDEGREWKEVMVVVTIVLEILQPMNKILLTLMQPA